ncbi:Histidine kinase [Rhodovastum atsumiense]|nr:ATP-binding protein [Rhodovastum atsumiense]CAH2599214.1 Histidine kinase [Rhodovastum atsumiense]
MFPGPISTVCRRLRHATMPLPAPAVRGRRRRDVGILHYVLVLSIILGIWASIGIFLRQERLQLEQAARLEASNLARALADSTFATLQQIDALLLFARDAYAADPDAFDLPAFVRRQFLTAPDLHLSLVGPDGIVRQSSFLIPSRTDLSDREHVRSQKESTEDRLCVGVPVIGRLSGRAALHTSRRIIRPDGGYGGALVVTVDPSHFERFFRSLEIGRGIVLLVGGDGVIRARAPAAADPASGHVVGRLAEEAAAGRDSGAFRGISEVDGIERVIGFRRVALPSLMHPLYVVVGRDTTEALAPYYQDRRKYNVAGACLTLLVAAAAAALLVQRWRLLQSQAALTATLENVSQGVIMIDAEGRVPVINRRAIELLSLPPELLDRHRPAFNDILRHQLDSGEFGPPEHIDPDFLRFVVSGGISMEYGIYERERLNGTVLEVRTQLLADGGAVRTYTDVTERRQNEQALATARDAAEAAGRARSDFLAVMSHEIRTPLHGIIGVAGLLLEMKLGATEQHYVRIVLESGNHLLQLINDILDFSRLDAARLELDDTAFDVRDVAGNAIELLSSEARAKGLTLGLDIAGDVPRRASGDARRLRQVLLNLLGNGIKFTAAGSVRLGVAALPAEPGRVRLAFTVTDTGIGIAPDAQERLFTAFTQVDSSISRRFGGSGLGLAICRRLVEQMGGGIAVESAPGKGSTFRFDILLRADAAEPAPGGMAPAADPAEPAERPQGLHVLLAEDNATNRLVATRMLERLGHRVTAVTNGLEALQAVSAAMPDVVLMDVMMPEMDGLTATSTIRRLPGPEARVPIIGLTANALRGDEVACLSAGMDHFATKPISADRLADAIAQVMTGRGGIHPPGAAEENAA